MDAHGALQPVDLAPYLADPTSAESRALCARVAACLVRTSALVVRDPRVPPAQNDEFLDLLERYYAQPRAAKAADERPEVHYQVGVTPDGIERPLCAADAAPAWCAAKRAALRPDAQPAPVGGPDRKWRFFWRVGERPASTGYAELNAAQVVPAAFEPEWAATLDGWGARMLGAVRTVAQMAAVGLGLPPDALAGRMAAGPHLLAPTGSDLCAHCAEGCVLAGWHRDLNLLTVHGKARFPGLRLWLRDGTKVAASVPPGHLLLQAGVQLEWLSGGLIAAGMHEVVVTQATREAVRAAAARHGLPPPRGLADAPPPEAEAEAEAGAAAPPPSGPAPLWRVSSTLFAHVASDTELAPLLGALPQELLEAAPELRPIAAAHDAAAAARAYPPTTAGEQVLAELRGIALAEPARAE